MADITPIVSLNGEISPIASLTGELSMPEKVWMQGPQGEQGPKGDTGETGPAGAGVPDGGTVGQLLGKTETGTAWIDPPQSGVQPDWNQNDSTAADYVKNRPFYTGNPVETVLVEESTVSFASADGIYIGQLESTFSPTVGETYKVSWDGTVYECVCVNFYDDTVIGNLSLMGDGSDTGEPFIMMVYNGQGIEIYTADASASHTFSISGTTAQIVKIPSKYIDKDASGYIVIHKNSTMTEQEAQNYYNEILGNEVVFIIWGEMCISEISLSGITDIFLKLTTVKLTLLVKIMTDCSICPTEVLTEPLYQIVW